MRILRLALENINSLKGAWTIDFQSPEFRSGIFAITGPTGSGKSTVLDAICLALYGKTPRLGKITNSENEVMNRESDSCRVVLDFETAKGIYRASWKQEKAKRSKVSGKLRAVESHLERYEAGVWTPVSEKGLKTEKDEQIALVTGLTFEQFRRSVLLAQGDFSAFLKAKEGAQAETLEQITGTEIYSKISKQVYETKKKKEHEFEVKVSSVNSLQTLEPEEVIEKTQALAHTTKKLAELDSALSDLRSKTQWLLDIQEIEKQAEENKKERDRLDGKKIAMEVRQSEIFKAEAAQKLEPLYNNITEINNEISQLSQRYAKALKQEEGATESLSSVNEKLTLVETSLREEENRRSKLSDLFSAVEILDAAIENIKSNLQREQKDFGNLEDVFSQDEKNLKKLETDVVHAKKTLEETEKKKTEDKKGFCLHEIKEWLYSDKQKALNFKEQLASAEKEVEKEQGEVSKKTVICNNAEKNLEKNRLAQRKSNEKMERAKQKQNVLVGSKTIEDLRNEAAEAQNRLTNLEKVSDAWASHSDTKLRLEKSDQQISSVTGKLEDLNKIKSELESRAELLEEKKGGLEEKVLINDDRLTAVRANLEDGKPCPVCGAIHHPYFKILPDGIKTAKTELEAVKRTIAKINLELKERNQQIEALNAELNQSKGINKTLLTTESQGRKKLIEAFQSAALNGNSFKTHTELSHFISSQKKELSGIKGKIQEAQKIAQEIQDIHDEQEKLRDSQLSVEREVTQAKTDLSNEKKALSNAQQKRDEEIKKKLTFWIGIGKRYGAVASEDEVTAAEPEIFDLWISAQQKYAELAEECNRLLSAYELMNSRIPDAREKLKSSRKMKEEKEKLMEAIKAVLSSKNEERKALFGEKSVEVERNNYETKVSTLRTEKEELQKRSQNEQTELARIKERRSGLSDDLKQKRNRLQSANLSWKEELQKSNFSSEADWKNARRSADVINALRKEVTDYQVALKSTDDQAAILSDRLIQKKKKNLTEKSLSVLNHEANVSDKERNALLTAKGALQQELKQNSDKLKQKEDLRKSLEPLEHELKVWKKLDNMIGSANGDKYRKFVQSLVLVNLLHRANEELSKLRSRYILTKGEGMEIKVKDEDLGGQIRPTSNLSGGESFVVSLSLALGLSRMSSEKVRIDSLFLDEGFGTLDEESLEKALNALGNLNARGKTVGLISHVEQIKSRIPAQIQVSPTSQPGVSKLSGAGVSEGFLL